jgi:hypothetical protein
MKATLEFNLPEEDEWFKTASESMKLSAACSEFANWLRGQIKRGNLGDETYKKMLEVREAWSDCTERLLNP